MTAPRNLGVMRVDAEHLARALNIPPGHQIIGVLPPAPADIAFPAVRLLVEGPTLPPVRRGVPPPAIILVVRARGRKLASKIIESFFQS